MPERLILLSIIRIDFLVFYAVVKWSATLGDVGIYDADCCSNLILREKLFKFGSD